VLTRSKKIPLIVGYHWKYLLISDLTVAAVFAPKFVSTYPNISVPAKRISVTIRAQFVSNFVPGPLAGFASTMRATPLARIHVQPAVKQGVA
jgi:hypothetical protein